MVGGDVVGSECWWVFFEPGPKHCVFQGVWPTASMRETSLTSLLPQAAADLFELRRGGWHGCELHHESQAFFFFFSSFNLQANEALGLNGGLDEVGGCCLLPVLPAICRG